MKALYSGPGISETVCRSGRAGSVGTPLPSRSPRSDPRSAGSVLAVGSTATGKPAQALVAGRTASGSAARSLSPRVRLSPRVVAARSPASFVVTSSGVVGIPSARLRRDADIDMPPCDRPDRLGPLLCVASLLVTHVPAASASKIGGAARRWHQFMRFIGAQGLSDWLRRGVQAELVREIGADPRAGP